LSRPSPLAAGLAEKLHGLLSSLRAFTSGLPETRSGARRFLQFGTSHTYIPPDIDLIGPSKPPLD
ncbi:hypothetical protein LCGC14_2735680, partial [marine sediment metagenome]